MDDRLYDALRRADRSQAMAAEAASIAAELNDLLTRVTAALALARASAGEESPAAADGSPDNADELNAADALAAAEDACDAARALTRRLAALNDTESSSLAPLALEEILRAAAAAAGVANVAAMTIAVETGLPAIAGHRDELVQAFRALIRNAAEAMSPPPPRPQIQVQARITALAAGQIADLPDGDYIEIEVRDNGCGIPAENLLKIWEPLFTTRKHAAGIGLPTALATIRRHGGQIGVDSAVNVGTVLTVFLPPAPPPPAFAGPAASTAAAPAAAARFRTGRILVMDDDEKIRALTAALLQRLDCTCDVARDAVETLSWYRRYWDIGRPYDAVLLDLEMPGGEGGAAVLQSLRTLDPDVRSIALAPLPPAALAERARDAGFAAYLAKPFKLAELGEALHTALAR